MKISRYESLDEAMATYLARVDELAGAIRSRHITDIAGQGTIYEYKRQDAQRYDGSEDPEAFPWVGAEAEAMEASMDEAAQAILARANPLWEGALVIERERMRAKHRIRGASTPRQMSEALADAESAMETASAALENRAT